MRLVALAAVLIAAGAAAQTPDGLVGRWRTVAPGSSATTISTLTFHADGSADSDYVRRPAHAYRITEPLRRDGAALRGQIEEEIGTETLYPDTTVVQTDAYAVLLDADRLALRTVSGRSDEGTVADFDRAAGAPGNLVGTWTLASLARARGLEQRRTPGEERLVSYTFTADSLFRTYRLPLRYAVSGTLFHVIVGAQFNHVETANSFRLDGDTLTLTFPEPMGALRLARVRETPTAATDLSAFVGRWTPVHVAADSMRVGDLERAAAMLFEPDGRVTTVSVEHYTYSIARGFLVFTSRADFEPRRYEAAFARDTLTLGTGGEERVVLARASGTPGRAAGRWTVVSGNPYAADSGASLRAITLATDGTGEIETAQAYTFALADGRLVLASPEGHSGRFRYRFDGDALTLSRPFDDVPVLALRRAD